MRRSFDSYVRSLSEASDRSEIAQLRRGLVTDLATEAMSEREPKLYFLRIVAAVLEKAGEEFDSDLAYVRVEAYKDGRVWRIRLGVAFVSPSVEIDTAVFEALLAFRKSAKLVPVVKEIAVNQLHT